MADTFGLIILLLSFLGAAYLFFVIILAFKQRGLIVGIAILNIIVFIYTYFFRPELITQYALSGLHLKSGMGYTLITYMFLHASPAHIFLNSLGLLFFGYNLEKDFGAAQVIMIYFVSGLIAGAAFILTSSPKAMVVGASGAIFGLMAYLTLIRPFLISPMPFLIPVPVALASVLYAILIIPALLAGTTTGGVAENAHLGGLLGGSLMAFAMNYMQALKGLAVVVVIASLTLILPRFFGI